MHLLRPSSDIVFKLSLISVLRLYYVLQALESFYEKFDPDFIDIRTKAREVLQREDDLNEIVQVVFPAWLILIWLAIFKYIDIITYFGFSLENQNAET